MVFVFCRSVNGLQNFSGLLETFGLISESQSNDTNSSNSTFDNGCTETSYFSVEQLLTLVSEMYVDVYIYIYYVHSALQF